MKDTEKIKKAFRICATGKCRDDMGNDCPYLNESRCTTKVIDDALECIETLEERVAIMTEGKEIKYVPEKALLFDEEYWFCGCCNDPIEHGNVERKHLKDYCYLCGAKVDKGDDDKSEGERIAEEIIKKCF